ncbi:Glucose 1-dehydrogenase [Jeotgalicoccus aerolatus]|uniref:NAD(P)-dependent dehydrogenase (Short-subunit alcohol dehydrogenase family) n=1 Tax=Jeotgalicoccus aerolatus TaxID=709510 RepID=A0ABS4HLU7_9STAP|nr:NAD(P)-dependent dehydrogenase (short-subunit alcohol dehydrogenase family) [Jeotgalicoccus aerolatus]GGD93949.1 hypothetical protein GCM10007273_02880 [Jeotgalicoccus aerolatus]CAD2074908.1 Glucose 1-dehydrogenase [Jeotgalicoccus aerolatus]
MKLIEDIGGKGIFVKADVTKPKDVQNLFKTAVDTYGGLDHAFNNAGVLKKSYKFSDIPVEDYDTVMAVDAKGVFLTTKYEIDYMRKKAAVLSSTRHPLQEWLQTLR